MKHLKTYEDKKSEDFLICIGFIKPENLNIIISKFEKNKLNYKLFEIVEKNNNYNIITIVKATESQRISLIKYITLVSNSITTAHIATTYPEITDMTADEILQRYDMFTNSKKYNL